MFASIFGKMLKNVSGHFAFSFFLKNGLYSSVLDIYVIIYDKYI